MAQRKTGTHCAYCGHHEASTDDHVVPRALYPSSKATSTVQRITVPACEACNRSWTDDEVHFRNILLISGEPNAPVQELWSGKARRSFGYADGQRRLRDMLAQMEEVQTMAGVRHMVYPGRDERIIRIVRKVIRGLCHHHGLLTPVNDHQVWADVQRYPMPPAFLDEMTFSHAEEDILRYRFTVVEGEEDLHSCWLLTFYERTGFFGLVFESVEAMERFEARTTQMAANPGLNRTDASLSRDPAG